MEVTKVQCVKPAMEQLSIQDQPPSTNPVSQEEPISTNSQIVQQKLAKMKELLKNMIDTQMYNNGKSHYCDLLRAGMPLVDLKKICEALEKFVTNCVMYEYELRWNIDKIETSQFVMLSELPLREAPKLLSFDEIMETFNVENINE